MTSEEFKLLAQEIYERNKGWAGEKGHVEMDGLMIDCLKSLGYDEGVDILFSMDAIWYTSQGGDYIKILDWLEEVEVVNQNFSFHLYTMNPVGRENMERIIRKNGWRLV